MQLPLPKHIDEDKVLSLIGNPHNIITTHIGQNKDVDGLHPLNVADLTMRRKTPRFVSCTPQGSLHLIKSIIPDLTGLRAAVLGRSNIVGMPMFNLLQRENATVTLCHSKTKGKKILMKSNTKYRY